MNPAAEDCRPARLDMAWGIFGVASLVFGTCLLVFVAVTGRC